MAAFACSTETVSAGSLGMFLAFSLSSNEISSGSSHYYLLLEAHPEHQNMSLWLFYLLGRGHIFIFNLTAAQLFLDMILETIWPSTLFSPFKRNWNRKERSWLGPICIFSVCINQWEPKLAKFSPLSGPVSQITSLL